MKKKYIDVLVIVPLQEELEEFLGVFAFSEDLCTATQFRAVVDSAVDDLVVVVVRQEEMGRSSASMALNSVLEEYDVGVATCVGIAGALCSDVTLGDVVFSSHIIDILDNAKASDVVGGNI